ncbi:MAG: type transport system permease protein [Solirubrobacteraceae bacterium]|jgi:ABC-2 type transport system permease protein|nr:type transport system permease protein [Solirubrobacteraceae bacterium]
MNLLAHEIRYDLLAIARNPRARVMTLAFPLILLVILVGISTGQTTVDGDAVGIKRFLVGGIATMSLMGAAYGSVVATVVTQRENGVYKRRRATPVSALVVVLGQAVATVTVALSTTAVLLVVAQALYGVGTSATGLALIAFAVVIGSLVFSCLAYAMASVVPNVDAAQPAIQLTMLPLYFLSGIWFSIDGLPDVVRGFARALPVEPLADLVHRGMQHPSLNLRDLAVLAAWAVAGAAIAARRFSWLPKEVAA